MDTPFYKPRYRTPWGMRTPGYRIVTLPTIVNTVVEVSKVRRGVGNAPGYRQARKEESKVQFHNT